MNLSELGAVAFHRQVSVPCVRAAVHHLTSDMLVFMCQGPEAERRGQGNFLTWDCVGVSCLCPAWGTEGRIGGSDIKCLWGRMGVPGCPFSEHTFVLAQSVTV